MFGNVVLGIDHSLFEAQIAIVKADLGVKLDLELGPSEMKEVVRRFKQVYTEHGHQLPSPFDQLKLGISAVFGSWNTPRAVKYRQINHISGLKGTAVNVQCMAYGNKNDSCATGVCFTRNPATGEPGLYGEYLDCAQGEDVVAGIRTPMPIHQMKESFGEAYADLLANTHILEQHMKDMQVNIDMSTTSGS
jgi:pyruvate, orthophosphate dikinase